MPVKYQIPLRIMAFILWPVIVLFLAVFMFMAWPLVLFAEIETGKDE